MLLNCALKEQRNPLAPFIDTPNVIIFLRFYTYFPAKIRKNFTSYLFH